jgi:putative Mg2+ transporter-C (MgtC) family protein
MEQYGLGTMLDASPSTAELADILVRLGAAGLLSGILGLERELKSKPLGLRPNILVALGACSFGLITMELVDLFRRDESLGQIDPSRVIQGIIEGIGFLGTGAIIQSRGDVFGTTTGATIWAVGAIGIACSFGLFVHAAAVTAVAFIVLTVLGAIERYFRAGSEGG